MPKEAKGECPKYTLLIFLFALVIGALSPAFSQTTQEAPGAVHSLAAPQHRQAFAEVIRPGNAVPDFDKGFLITKVSNSLSPETTNVVIYSKDGGRVREARIWFPGANRVVLFHAAVTDAGKIVASGFAETPGGIAYFIARTDLAGRVAELARTNPFRPAMVCAGSDGTVWTFGRDMEAEDAGQDYDMLRQFSFRKGFARSYAPRRSFSTEPRLLPEHWNTVSGGLLRCTKNRVGYYSLLNGDYIEVQEGSGLRRWKLDSASVQGMRVWGIAVTESGAVFASLSNAPGTGNGHWRGIFELVRDDASGTARWVLLRDTVSHPVPGEAGPRALYGKLYGTDGRNLVVSKGWEEVVWVEPVRATKPNR